MGRHVGSVVNQVKDSVINKSELWMDTDLKWEGRLRRWADNERDDNEVAVRVDGGVTARGGIDGSGIDGLGAKACSI